MSNHTSGTYTFVRDWYDLRDCMAGCVGGMMSIALTNVKLHMRVVDGVRFRMRKVSGAPHAIVSTDGHDVHVDIGELRYGEKKEMLLELELDNASDHAANGGTLGGAHDGGERRCSQRDRRVCAQSRGAESRWITCKSGRWDYGSFDRRGACI